MSAGTSGGDRDVLLFLPPNTAKPQYQVDYPYGLNVDGTNFVQPFVAHLAVGYPFGRYHLTSSAARDGEEGSACAAGVAD
jgi:hypothetical protein